MKYTNKENEVSIVKMIMAVLVMLFLLNVLTACGGGAGGSGAASDAKPVDPTPAPIVAPPVVVIPPNNNQPTTINLTYYTLGFSEAPVNGWPTKTYQSYGYCVIYLTNTYCWDDGLHTLTWTFNNFTYGPYKYTYWSLNGSPSNFNHCHGGCTTDALASPTLMSFAIINTVTNSAINDIFTQGTPRNVTCTENANSLDCGDFVIDL